MQLLTCVSIYHKPGLLTFQDLRLQFLEYILHPLSADNTLLNLILRFYRYFRTPRIPDRTKTGSGSTTNKRERLEIGICWAKKKKKKGKKKVDTEPFSHQPPGAEGGNWPAAVFSGL